MPEIYRDVLKKAELRDLIEYLGSLKTPKNVSTAEPSPRALRGITGR
jgi:hypothetical protein